MPGSRTQNAEKFSNMDYNPAAELGVFFEPNHYKFILKYDFKPYFDKKKNKKQHQYNSTIQN